MIDHAGKVFALIGILGALALGTGIGRCAGWQLQQLEERDKEDDVDRLKLNGIVSGQIIQQAVPDRTLRTVSLVLAKDGQRTAVPDQNLSFATNLVGAGTFRADMIQWDGHTLSVKQGVDSTVDPTCPAPDTGNIPVAVIYLPYDFSEIRNMGTRFFTGTWGAIVAYYHVTGMAAMILAEGSGAFSTPAAAVAFTRCVANLYYTHPLSHYEFSLTLYAVSGTALNPQYVGAIIFNFDGVNDYSTYSNQVFTLQDVPGAGPPQYAPIHKSQLGKLHGVVEAELTPGAHKMKPMIECVVAPAGSGFSLSNPILLVKQVR